MVACLFLFQITIIHWRCFTVRRSTKSPIKKIFSESLRLVDYEYLFIWGKIKTFFEYSDRFLKVYISVHNCKSRVRFRPEIRTETLTFTSLCAIPLSLPLSFCGQKSTTVINKLTSYSMVWYKMWVKLPIPKVHNPGFVQTLDIKPSLCEQNNFCEAVCMKTN